MSKWVPLNNYSHYSLQLGLSKGTQIVDKCLKLGYSSAAIVDRGSISGVPSFLKAVEKKKKKGQIIKPIIGTELFLCDNPKDRDVPDNSKTAVFMAKNLDGWKSLIANTSLSNSPEFFMEHPRAKLEDLKTAGLICIVGNPGSDVADCIFKDSNMAYSSTTYDQARGFTDDNWKKNVQEKLDKYIQIFGKENLFLSLNLVMAKKIPALEIVAKTLKWFSKKMDLKCIASHQSFYPESEDATDQRVLLANHNECSLSEIANVSQTIETLNFLRSNSFYIQPEENILQAGFEQCDIDNTLLIESMCEVYDIFKPPTLPTFDCPGGMSPDEYLREKCIRGWKKFSKGIPKDKLPLYGERIKSELAVFKDAGLASYFLIVNDYCDYSKSNGWLMSPGRGSAAGSLVAAIIGITDKSVDPIEHSLLFERFYNAGRNAPGRVSLPDIDCDFMVTKRHLIKDYIRNRYGDDRVSEMVTFSRMQGKGGLKGVMRAHGSISFDDMNKMSNDIPDEAEIADELNDIKEAGGEPSIIKWSLENLPNKFKQWCVLEKDGTYSGEYAKIFEQAIRLEGTKIAQGKHAAGIIISPAPLAPVCPMVYDKSADALIAGMEMADLEAMGHVKFDILGVAILDKIVTAVDIINNGE